MHTITIVVVVFVIIIIVDVFLVAPKLLDNVQILSPQKHDNCYERVEDISNTLLKGKWKASQSAFPGHFARSKNISFWRNLACPAEMRMYSCYLRSYSAGRDAENSQWHSTSCRLDSFHPVSFLEHLRNRRLLFSGDSLQMQFFQTIVCSLHDTGLEMVYNLSWADISHIFGPDMFHLDCNVVHSVYYPAYNATVLLYIPNSQHHYDSNFLSQYIELGSLSFNDVVIVNFGVAWDSIESAVLSLAKQHSELESTNRPWLIWREVSIQHFQNTNKSVPLGYYNGSNNNLPCLTRIDRNRAYEEDYRNRFAERVMLQHNITILRTSTALYDAMNMHCMKQWRVGGAVVYDCTHYCMPSGVFYHWRDLLFNAFRARDNV